METENPEGHPMMAQPALQQGKLLGKILKLIQNKAMEPFEYNDKDRWQLWSRNKAVVDLPNYHFSGVFAWFVWMFVHLFSLIGFKNKAVVFLNWVYNYIRFDRDRLIHQALQKLYCFY
jgi:NADH dehydrogenase